MGINATLNQVEKWFNIGGSLPILGAVSGGFRIAVGSLQAPIGGVVGGAGLVGQMIYPESKNAAEVTKAGAEQILHGTLNTIRGLGEAIAAVTLFGSLVPLVIQSRSENGFDPVIRYGDSSSQINRSLNKIERRFNIAGSIPVVGVGSGLVRVSLSGTQMYVGAMAGGAGLFGRVIHPDSQQWANIAEKGAEQFIHGVLNSVRGTCEVVSAGLVLPSLATFFLQMVSSNGFDPRIKYDETA